MADEPDAIELVASELYAAFYMDTSKAGQTWPPEKSASVKAWRRVAARAIDMGVRP